jgi:pimeloyl-ACP methyl ester carboxylesterase
MASIAASCNVRLLDLKAMNASLPIPRPSADLRVFVVGGEEDFVVDVEGLRETAAWGNTEAVVLKRTAHDVMLDTRWEGGARALEGWMETL